MPHTLRFLPAHASLVLTPIAFAACWWPVITHAQEAAPACMAPQAPPEEAPADEALPQPNLNNLVDRDRETSVTRERPAAIGQNVATAECGPLVQGAVLALRSQQAMRLQLNQQQLRLLQRQQADHLGGSPWLRGERRLSVWAQGGSVTADQGDTLTAAGLAQSSADLNLGADYRLNEHAVVGAGLALQNPHLRWLGTASRVKGQQVALSLYGLHELGRWGHLSLTAARSTDRYRSTTDQGDGTVLDGRHRGHTTGLSLQWGQDFAWGSHSVAPYLRLDQVRTRLMDATVGDTLGRSDAASLGVQWQASVPQTWGVLLPYARLEWSETTRLRLTGTSAQAYATAQGWLPAPAPQAADRHQGSAAVGLSSVNAKGMSLFADYEQGIGLSNTTRWRFSAGVRQEL
jgi:outer membrane autotransporter protein